MGQSVGESRLMKTRNLLPRVYDLKTYPGRPSPYVVRWVVNGLTRGKSFTHKMQADNFRAALIHAINSRERFSKITGLPQSMETTGVSVATARSSMDRASDYRSEGCRFDSGRAHHYLIKA